MCENQLYAWSINQFPCFISSNSLTIYYPVVNKTFAVEGNKSSYIKIRLYICMCVYR